MADLHGGSPDLEVASVHLRRRGVALWLLTLLTLLALVPAPAEAVAAGQNRVYILRMDQFQEIGPWIAQRTERVFDEAEKDPNAVAVAMVIDTPGGLLVSSIRMKQRILASKLRSIALVQDHAWSAGALIATAAEKLYMSPGSSIGAAEPRVAGSKEAADYKTVSAVVGDFVSTAKARGRDPQVAQAFVDRTAKIPGQTTELLTLSYQDAVDKKYADGVAGSLDEALKQAGITNYQLVEAPMTLSDQVGRFLTTPWVATLLLVVGVAGLGIEFMKPGVTVPGLLGVISLGLFFAGNVLVGTANWLELGLALIGVLLLVVEAFVPGFGIFGLGGVAAIAASIFLAVPSTDLAIRYLAFTAVAFMVVLFALIRTIGRQGLGKHLTLEAVGKGWVPSRSDYSNLIGREGKALTVLRPAGTAQFGDQKLDVVTEGDYVDHGAVVVVLRVEGTRVVVRVKENG